ncbi:hypothetical protein ASF12_10690 [Paenibacillus sp. Leaf72]|nr:hypothetical protein ASF12_10690 [Paenibacillus sp. Leaf72]
MVVFDAAVRLFQCFSTRQRSVMHVKEAYRVTDAFPFFYGKNKRLDGYGEVSKQRYVYRT